MTSLLMRRAAMMRHRQETALSYLCFTAVDATAIAWSKVGTLTKGQAIEYSTDGVSWTAYTFGTPISLAVGEKCYFRGDNTSFSESPTVYLHFTSTGRVAASGNMMSLVDKTCTQTSTTTSMFVHAFDGCTTLLSAPELPATTLALNSYRYMFKGCTALTQAPYLPTSSSTYNYTYGEMFSGCTNLSVIRVGLTVWRSSGQRDWVKNVSPTGTFYCPSALDTSTPGVDRNPPGWTVINTD